MATRFCVAFWNTLFMIELFSADTSRLNMAKTGDMSSEQRLEQLSNDWFSHSWSMQKLTAKAHLLSDNDT